MQTKILMMVWTLGFLFFQTAQSQSIHYFGLFPTIDHSAKLHEKWSYNLYLFDAIKPYSHSINQKTDAARSFYLYGEAGLSYQLTPQLSATMAYVQERQNPFRADYRIENRLFQQLTLKLPWGKSELKQRLRFDERFVTNRSTGNAPLTHRLRYLAGAKYPISDKIYLFGYSEFFFNTVNGNSFRFEENWSALQLGFKWNDCNSIEAGLLYVGWLNQLPSDWLHQFYLQLTWVSQLDFTKQKQ